jgi:hypothetical protein
MSAANRSSIVRTRSPFFGDLVIVVLGIWGFVRQCLRVLLTRGRSNEFESTD